LFNRTRKITAGLFISLDGVVEAYDSVAGAWPEREAARGGVRRDSGCATG